MEILKSDGKQTNNLESGYKIRFYVQLTCEDIHLDRRKIWLLHSDIFKELRLNGIVFVSLSDSKLNCWQSVAGTRSKIQNPHRDWSTAECQGRPQNKCQICTAMKNPTRACAQAPAEPTRLGCCLPK